MDQRKEWVRLRELIDMLVSKVTTENIQTTSIQLFGVNLVRGRGLLVRSVMESVLATPQKCSVLAALVSILNSKIPEIGEIAGARVVALLKKAYVENKRQVFRKSLLFLCHLLLQKVVEDIVILQVLQVLLEQPTETSIEATTEILVVAGKHLDEKSKTAANMVFDRLRLLLQEGGLLGKSQRDVTEILRLRRSGLRLEFLDLVEDEDRETHFVDLTEPQETHTQLNYFQEDENYHKTEEDYEQLRREIAPEDATEQKEELPYEEKVVDLTDSVLLQHQKNIYLTVMSSMSADEAVHKLLRLQRTQKLDGPVLADMIIKCCAQEKTYSKYFGVIGEKMCRVSRNWHHTFTQQFVEKYNTIYQFEGAQLRNLGKFFGHLLAADSLAPQETLGHIELTEEKTSSASRVFIKFLFQEMVEELGIAEVQQICVDPDVRQSVQGMLPTDSEDADRLMFSINYFTAIGLGVLTEEMRDALKSLPESRGRKRSRSGSRSGSSRSGSRSGSYSRSRSGSYSRSGSSRSRSRSPSHSRSPLRTPRPEK